ncbi:MAG: hypothetical protein MPJ50_02620 [Pirellulales bacterium]|nr:hypothetical protein [Pirellulales bacterium]
MLHRGLILGLVASFVFLLGSEDNSAEAQPLFTRPNTSDRTAADFPRLQELQQAGISLKSQLTIGNSSRPPSGSQQEFERYFNFYLERMTLEAGRMDLPGLRSAIGRDLASFGSGAAHDQVVQHMLTNLEKLAKDEALDGVLPVTIGRYGNQNAATDGRFPVKAPYHRATRTNAMYLIGELNSEEPRRQGQDTGTPFPEALPVLVNVWNDTDQPIEVRFAALSGIDRHARIGVPNNQAKSDATAAMLALLNEAEPPEGRSAAAHLWLRQSAATILGNLGNTGNSQEVLNALISVVGNKQAALKLRCAAGAALAPLDYSDVEDVRAVGRALGTLAVEAAVLETSNRSYLRHYLACVSEGIGVPTPAMGHPDPRSILAAASSAEDKAFVEELAQHVSDLAGIVEEIDRDAPDETGDDQKISPVRKGRIMTAASQLQAFLRPSAAGGE